MRVARFASLVVLAWVIAIGSAVVPSAQTKTDEDYDKLMKAVGATVGSMRKNIEGQMADGDGCRCRRRWPICRRTTRRSGPRARCRKRPTGPLPPQAHATEVEKAVAAKNMASAGEHMKLLMGTCAQCHAKYRDKAADGTYMIKKQ